MVTFLLKRVHLDPGNAVHLNTRTPLKQEIGKMESSFWNSFIVILIFKKAEEHRSAVGIHMQQQGRPISQWRTCPALSIETARAALTVRNRAQLLP